MVRAWRPPAREPATSWLARRSTMATSTPANASSPASISPVGPAPAITTACSVTPIFPPLFSYVPTCGAERQRVAVRIGEPGDARARRRRPDAVGVLIHALVAHRLDAQPRERRGHVVDLEAEDRVGRRRHPLDERHAQVGATDVVGIG